MPSNQVLEDTTYLQCLKDAALEIGLDDTSLTLASASIAGNSQWRTLHRHGQRTLEFLKRQHDWQRLSKEGSITFVADQNNYALPTDYLRFSSDTWWDRENNRRAVFPIDPVRWGVLKGWVSNVEINRQVRILGGEIVLYEAPSASEAGDQLYFEYISNNCAGDDISDPDAATPTTDTQHTIFSPHLVTLGVVYRFRRAKGYDWKGDKAEFDRELQQEIANDGGSSSLNMVTTLERYIPTPSQRDYGYG